VCRPEIPASKIEISRLVIGRDHAQHFVELARICIAHSRVTASLEVTAELRRIAKEYRKKAADLEWENWPADGEENVGKVLQEG
jgi:hypothetical protein